MKNFNNKFQALGYRTPNWRIRQNQQEKDLKKISNQKQLLKYVEKKYQKES